MSRSRAYRRFTIQKTKRKIRKWIKQLQSSGVNLYLDPLTVGKLANHGKIHVEKTFGDHVKPYIHKLTKREIISLDELKNFENYI